MDSLFQSVWTWLYVIGTAGKERRGNHVIPVISGLKPDLVELQ